MTDVLSPLPPAATPDTNLTESLEELNRRYADALRPMAVWLGLLAVLGILGNLLVIVVFTVSPEYKNTNFKVFVISLAAVDLLTCVTLMPADIIKTRYYFSFADGIPCKIKCFFNLFGQNACAYVLLVICVDRFRKVCMPLKHQIWPGLATKLVLWIMFLSVLLSLPAPFLCGISSSDKENIHGTVTTVYFCAAEEKYKHSVFRKVYKIGLTVSLCCVAVAFIIMYSLILKNIIRHWKNVGNGRNVRFENGSMVACPNNKDRERHLRGSSPHLAGGLHVAIHIPYGHPDCEAAMAINGGARADRKTRSGSTQSLASTKPMFIVRQNGILRSSSDYSLKAFSIRRRLSYSSGRIPYKTLIWIILTFVFILTFFINALLSFTTTELYKLSPQRLLLFMFFFRIYFINNIINPIIYICLDKRFKVSCCHLVNLIKRRWRLCCT